MADKISFGVESIDRLLDGGLKKGFLTAIFGRSGIGKTFLTIQLASYFTVQEKNAKVLYINTEGDFDVEEWKRIIGFFKKRWPDMDESRIVLKYIPDIFALFRYLGMSLEIKQGEKRVSVFVHYPKTTRDVKTSTQKDNWLEYAPIWKDIEREGYGLIILDSLSMIIKNAVPSDTQNLPARSTLTNRLLNVFRLLAEKFNIPIVYTVHASVHPQGLALDQPFGGWDLRYGTKYIIGILPPIKDIVPSSLQRHRQRFRRIIRYRYGFRDMEMVPVILAKDLGFVDVQYFMRSVVNIR